MTRPAERYELREVKGGWALASSEPPAVPADQTPQGDMPPVILMLLEAWDDQETVHAMRDCGNSRPYGLALVGEQHILNALRAGLADGLIAVTGALAKIVLEPSADDASLRRYWFGHPRAPKGLPTHLPA